MRTNWLVSGIAMLVVVVAIGAVACGDDDDSSDSNGGPAGAVVVRITSPENSAEVTSPVTVTIIAEGIVIAPASEGQTGAAHYVVGVDGANGSLVVGEVVGRGQEGEGIYQYAVGSTELELEPGEHTVSVNLADNDDLLTDDALVSVTFTVVE